MKTNDRSILNEIEKSEGYSIALLTTYNFEIDFFEKFVFSLLSSKEIRTTNVFVDTHQLNNALISRPSGIFGKHYFVTPVLINGAFHPKVILLLGENKAKLIVSSANIKLSGYFQNNEVYNIFEYSENDTRYSNLIADAVKFFETLFSIAATKDPETEKALKEFGIAESHNDASHYFIHNLNTSIIEQLTGIIHEKVTGINIAVPFYDKSLRGLQKLKNAFQCSNIKLYIQNKKNTFPIEYNESHSIVTDESILLFDSVNNETENKRFYHGKVIEFITDKYSYIMFGSANCSANALINTSLNYGNIECDVLVKNEVSDADSFFRHFVLGAADSFANGFADSMPVESHDYNFVFGEVIDHDIYLYIDYKTKNDISVSYYGQILEYNYVDKYLRVKLPLDSLLLDNRQIVISISSLNSDSELVCWYNDHRELFKYRHSTSISLPHLDKDDDLSKYQEYFLELERIINENQDWFTVSRELTAGKKQNNPDDYDDDEIYLLDEDVEIDYSKQRTSFEIYKSVSGLSGRYFKSLFAKPEGSHRRNVFSSNLDYPAPAEKERLATPAEKRLSRIFKKYFNLILTKDNYSDYSYDKCQLMFGAILDLIARVYYIDKVKDYFELSYILDTKLRIADILVNKAVFEHRKENADELIAFVFQSLIESEYHNHNKKENTLPAEIIYRLNELKSIRENFNQYVLMLDFTLLDAEGEDIYQFGYIYIDSLFGYKTKDQLIEYVAKTYGAVVEYTFEKKMLRFILNVKSAKFPKEGLYDRVVKEIVAYIKGYKTSQNKIVLLFVEESTGNRIIYEMKTDGNTVFGVMRYQYINNSNCSFKCDLHNGIWKVIFQSRKMI